MISFLKGLYNGNWKSIRSDADGNLAVGPNILYKATPDTLADGATGALVGNSLGSLKVDLQTHLAGEDLTNGVIAVIQKPLSVGDYTWSVDISPSLEASSIVKASPGVLRRVSLRVDSTLGNGTYYIHCVNAVSLPADGAVSSLFLCAPEKVIHVAGTDNTVEIDFGETGVPASIGMVVYISSTEFTKTIAGAFTSSTIRYA